ncbi:hypothetical protein NDK50_25975 [Paraburkholderia bryophila]|uniref:hypothetical protein n=1 Tax=Paraburkholderia bryophila TaxID=420952 RepID=UPI00234BCC1F|nr:hypothetical protein [Paraburkholderia bryophila]WCM24277.1 hypothetical protein NDK50_25975 [Paraburkholderia bryophila]
MRQVLEACHASFLLVDFFNTISREAAMKERKSDAVTGGQPVQPPGGGNRGNAASHGPSSSPGGASSSSLTPPTPPTPATPSSTSKKPPSDKPQNKYRRELTQEIHSLAHPSGGVHTPDNSRLLGLGRTAQELSKFHEQATREHWKERARTEGPALAAQAAKASQSRIGSALSVPELHKELAPPKATRSSAKGTERQSLKIQDTHVAIPTEHGKTYPEFTVSLKDKGGRSTAYPVMAAVSVHPATGRAPSHKVLTTLEAQRSDGRDSASTLSKARLLQRGELTPLDAIAVDKHGTFELPGAQATGDQARAEDVIARNTGRTIEQYGRSTSPRGRRLLGVVETLNDPATKKRKRRDSFLEGSRILAEIEPAVFDAPRTPPGSPDYRAVYSHFGLSSPTQDSAPVSSSSRALSPLRRPPASPPSTQTSTSSGQLSPLFASSPSGSGARKVARQADTVLGVPAAPALNAPTPTFAFPPVNSSFPTPWLPSPGGSSQAFSSSPFSAFSPAPRPQPSTSLSPFPPTSPHSPNTTTTTSRTSLSAPGPADSHGGQSHSGPGAFSPFTRS